GDGRPQARRVRADAHVPLPRRPGEGRAREALTVPAFGVKTNERPGTRAVVRHVRMSAYKVREVLDLIRDKEVQQADEILQFAERDAAIVIRKALHSAMANAENNDQIDSTELYVSAC